LPRAWPGPRATSKCTSLPILLGRFDWHFGRQEPPDWPSWQTQLARLPFWLALWAARYHDGNPAIGPGTGRFLADLLCSMPQLSSEVPGSLEPVPGTGGPWDWCWGHLDRGSPGKRPFSESVVLSKWFSHQKSSIVCSHSHTRC
jgi:hypothetical protein